MKILNYGNLAIVFTLITSLILTQFNSYFSGTAFILGLFIMPAYQLLVGFIWLISSDEDKKIRKYFLGVIIYFVSVFSFSAFAHSIQNIKIIEQIMYLIFGGAPIILALYFTYILNQYSRR